jgi:hypothetical protein
MGKKKSYRKKTNYYQLKKMVKNELQKQVEKKHHHVPLASTVGPPGGTPNTPIFVSVTNVENGTASNQRVGNSIKPSGVYINYMLQASAAESETQVRIMLLSSRRGAITVSEAPASFLGPADFDRYWVFYERYHIMNSTNTTQRGVIKLGRKALARLGLIQFDSTLTANAIRNNIYMFAQSNVGTNANAPNIDVDINFYYTDA